MITTSASGAAAPEPPEPPLPPLPPEPSAFATPRGPSSATTTSGTTTTTSGTTTTTTATAAARRRRLLTETEAWPGEILTWVGVGVAAIALYAVSVPLDTTLYGLHLAVAFGVALLQAASLPLAMRWPWASVASFLSGQALFGLLGSVATAGAPWPVSVPQMVAIALVGGLLAWRGHGWPAFVLWLGAATIPLGAAFLPERGAMPEGVVASLVTSAAVSAVVVGLGHAAAVARVRFASAIDEERRQGAAEHERRLLAEERTRIARDLHDVVAHRMSVIQVQATSAPYRMPGLDPAVAEEFGEIAQGARDALAEMRGLLAVLRDPEAEAQTAPQPGFGDLPALIASVRQAGLPLEDRVDADLPGGPVVGQVAYRIVQEALSNVLRHAPGAATTVTVAADGGSVVVTVENAATDASATPSTGSSATTSPNPGRPADTTRPHAEGHGIIGMRERVRSVGGVLVTGPVPSGGFWVRAVLPAAVGA